MIPRIYPELADKINELIEKGFKIYADVDKKTNQVTRIYGDKLNKRDFKKEKDRLIKK